jgi:hypothetical protein
MTERNVTMAATPTAMQRKKKSRRLQDDRVSRTAMRRTNIIDGPAIFQNRHEDCRRSFVVAFRFCASCRLPLALSL